MNKTSNFFKTSAILSTALLSMLGACAIDDPIDYTTSFEGPSTADSPSTADQDANNESFLSFEGVFAQDEAGVNTERKIQFSLEDSIDANKEYSVTIDGNEFKYTTTSSPDHQTLASQLAQAIDSNELYSATAEGNVIRIHTGAGNSSISATKVGALTEIIGDPPTDALVTDNPSEVDVAVYWANTMSEPVRSGSRTDLYLEAIENYYSDELNMTTKKINEKFNGSDPNSALLLIAFPGQALDSAEIESIRLHLESGGRVFFIAENNSCCSRENINISNALDDLGGSMSVKDGSHSQRTLNNTSLPKNLNNSDLNAGVKEFSLSAYAELIIDPKISQAIMIDNAQRIVAADQALLKGRATLIADVNFIGTPGSFFPTDSKVFLSNLAIDAHNNQKKVQDGINPNENFAPSAGTVETIYTSVASFDIVGQTLTIKSTNEKIGKEIQFESQSNGESNVEFKDEKLFVTYYKGVSTTEEIVALLNAYPEFSATTTGNIIIP